MANILESEVKQESSMSEEDSEKMSREYTMLDKKVRSDPAGGVLGVFGRMKAVPSGKGKRLLEGTYGDTGPDRTQWN